MSDTVLILGSGGREHALAWKIGQSPDVKHVYVTPGNAGTNNSDKTSNVVLNVNQPEEILSWCRDNHIQTVVVGPEAPLADGISDLLNGKGIPCFGPSAKAAEIEASKHFAKEFMERWKIPTARYKAFTDVSEAHSFINSSSFPALVVKASGLAAGKGVIVAADKSEACKAVQDILQCQKFGAAGTTVVVEELLKGEEISCLAFTDGKTVHMMPPAQDYKRLEEGDIGPNTGGMGAYCPCPMVSAGDLDIIRHEVLQRAVDGLRAEGRPYQGVLYAGLMLTNDGPKVLEFNCRFGDPETQVLLPLLESDLYQIILACIRKQLHTITPRFRDNQFAVAIVTVAKGYPEKYNKGTEITGLSEAGSSVSGRMVFHAGTKVKDNQILTNGGRVLAVVAMGISLSGSVSQALEGADLIHYEGKVYRRDIAKKALASPLTYSDSGVSIEAGVALVDNIKSMIQRTLRPGCLADLGMFGGAFDLRKAGYTDPLLVSGTDGVGTKLKIAQICNDPSSVGIDLVAMCVNDILCHGAEPLFFLDYFACGRLEVGVAAEVVKGVAIGCQQAGCALIGGETAEMPGMYKPGEYDIAGFTVGAVERAQYLPEVHAINPGDHVIGLASSGIHSNGFSLVRKIIDITGHSYGDKCPFDAETSLGEALLTPTEIYVKPVLSLLKTTKVKAIAHITGGGLPGNLSRVLPSGLDVQLDATKWHMPNVFRWLAQKGNVEDLEMLRTFNCGIGLVLIVDRQDKPETICRRLASLGCTARCIGSTVSHETGQDKVRIINMESSLRSPVMSELVPKKTDNGVLTDSCDTVSKPKKRVGILISGSGTNMQALIDYTNDPVNQASSEIALVISNKAGVTGLTLAQEAGIQTMVISHKDHKTRVDFDGALHASLTEHNIDIVCLAGFMRILTGEFVRKWKGCMLNVHPSLLPSFKGANAHEQVLACNVRISGCTVHFVAEEVDAGAILVQQSVPVYPDDTMDTLSERVKCIEHQAFPRALELVSSGKAVLGEAGNVTWSS